MAFFKETKGLFQNAKISDLDVVLDVRDKLFHLHPSNWIRVYIKDETQGIIHDSILSMEQKVGFCLKTRYF